MTTRYTIINWKEYVSLRRYWNMQWKYKTQKAKCDELEKENKELKEKLLEADKYVVLQKIRNWDF